jgi:hypothetical protein
MNILDYDQHAGYDYPSAGKGTHIHAATSGILCYDTNTTTKRNGLWRNTAECPYVKAAYSSGAYNSFYIVHENTLLTRYLHGEGDYYGLTKKVYDQIVAKGYAEVKRGDHVGYVGGATELSVSTSTSRRNSTASWSIPTACAKPCQSEAVSSGRLTRHNNVLRFAMNHPVL